MKHLIFLGTKAQLVKMAPIFLEMNRQNIAYDFCWSGQHQETIGDLLEDFNLSPPNIVLVNEDEKNTKIKLWLWLIKVFFRFNRLLKENKYCSVVVHGDTLSTLVGSLGGYLNSVKIVHVEAGLSSEKLFKPFPEEIIRRIVGSLARVYFCQDESSYNRVKDKGDAYLTMGNSLIDSARIVSNKVKASPHYKNDYILVSIHRVENVEKSRLVDLCDFLGKLSEKYSIKFVLHSVTKNRLLKYGLMSILEQYGIELLPRTSYSVFLSLIRNSRCLITDGGSNQEECFYLGHPCLIWREETERLEGLDKNAFLCNRDFISANRFIDEVDKYRNKEFFPDVSPSGIIAKQLANL